MAAKAKKNVYEIVTERLVAELEKGVIPWRKPWRTEGAAVNYVSRKEYRGINRLLLGGGEYMTFKQAQERGGKVRKGAKASMAVFWKMYEKENADGKVDKIPVLRYYNVFSIHDIEGIESKLPPVERKDIDPIPQAAAVFDGYVAREGIVVEHANINAAFYRASDDLINLPMIGQYDNAAEYYSTAYHEAAHSTGHTTRLARDLSGSAMHGSGAYSREELVAEIAAAYLCEHAGISAGTIENSAAYIKAWSDMLKQDARLAVMAASAAEKAAAYILGEGAQDDGEK